MLQIVGVAEWMMEVYGINTLIERFRETAKFVDREEHRPQILKEYVQSVGGR